MAINDNSRNYDELSSVNHIISDEVWPPGFRFHPTDEELVLYYLKRKICRRRLKLDVLAQIDVYKHEPEELPGLSLLKNGDRQWFFFSPRDRKYPKGSRSNRATRYGYWKATGKDRTITCNSRNVGLKKTLVFYRGRAPSGARTDWVMHEYTLDEDELKRCQNAQDYYAIYKVFKKSGPGPKNGEQYGAPFREEDWVDDYCRAITCNTDQTDHAVQAKKVVVHFREEDWVDDNGRAITCDTDQTDHAVKAKNAVAHNSCEDAKVDPLFDDIEEIMNRLIPEPPPQPPDFDDFEKALSQFVGEEEFHDTLVNASFGEVTYAEPCTTYAVNSQQNGFETSFDVTHTTTSGLQTWDAPEVTSNNANTFNLPPIASEEDFLEMNDLLGPGPSNEYDIFYDANIGVLPHQNANPQEGGWVHQASFQQQHYPESASLFGNEMWSYGPNTCLTTTMATNPGSVLLPPTGIVGTGNIGTASIQKQQSGKDQHVEGAVQTQPQTETQNQNQNQPWFSSTLWSFVESIPAAPASAAESALVNKAFQRMSSFSRVRISTKSTTLTARGTTCISASTCSAGVCGRIKVFFLLSFLVALFAVVCLFIGSKSSGKLHCRMSL